MQPLLSTKQTIRSPRTPDALLREVLQGIRRAPIYERQIRHSELFVFGSHDVDTDAIVLNVPLLRVLVFLHEGLHRAKPEWSERAVKAKSVQLLQQLDDDLIAELNAELVAVIRATR
jgi:hypothetical protein